MESLLLDMSQRGHPHLSRELDPVLEGVVKARAAVAGDRTAAPEFIETLGAHLNMLLLKGGLVLHGSELGER